MDPRLLPYYEKELQYIREAGSEFAAEFPKIAGRLGIDSLECSDPYVERLIESFAFLAARIQLKHEQEIPRFTSHLLEVVYPQYLCPIPSSCIVEFEPGSNLSQLEEGYVVPKGTRLESIRPQGTSTACEFTTTQDVHLWPVEISEAAFYNRDVSTLALPPQLRSATGAVRIRLRLSGNVDWEELQLDDLVLYLTGQGETPVGLLEQIIANGIGGVVRPVVQDASDHLFPQESILCRGLAAPNLLPNPDIAFEGYALLQEYFTLPEKFLFVEVKDLRSRLRMCGDAEVDIIIALTGPDAHLGRTVDADCFKLNCCPATNLTQRRADAVQLQNGDIEHHIVPDRTRPLDFEIFRVTNVIGYNENDESLEFTPFFSTTAAKSDERRFYTLARTPRLAARHSKVKSSRSSYMGSECYLSIVDRRMLPQSGGLRTLSVEILATNRDLPLLMPIGAMDTDFYTDSGAPVERIKCVAGPTAPLPSRAHQRGELLWQAINHLSPNYMSLVNQNNGTEASALRSLLKLYVNDREVSQMKQIECIRGISSKGINRPLPDPGPMSFCRGVEINLTLDETGFTGRGAFLLGAVLERFFSHYVAVNSFTEMVLKSEQRGEIKRWKARLGRRHLI